MSVLGDIGALWEMRRRLSLPPQQLAEVQATKLRALVQHAHANVPFYRRWLDDAGVRPEDIHSVDDLRRIPVISKRCYQDVAVTDRQIASPNAKPLEFATSGSSGIPLRIHMTKKERAHHALYTLRAELTVGARVTDRVAVFSPRMRNTTTEIGTTPTQRWFERFGLLRKFHFDVLESPALQINRLSALRPQIMIGYPSHLCVLAEEYHRRRIVDWRPRLVFTNSEPLTLSARHLITTNFGAAVFPCYDAWEMHQIAWECERHDGMHINSDHVIVEILADGQPAATGEVVVTNLDLYTTPILRYAIGDQAELASEPCRCGRTLPRLQAVHGRSSDVAYRADGQPIPLLAFNVMLSHLNGVLQYRLVEQGSGDFRLELVAGENYSSTEVDDIVAWAHDHFGTGVRITAARVDEIPADASGKRPFFVRST